MAEDNPIASFEQMWGTYPAPVMLRTKAHVIIGTNRAAQEAGIPTGTNCDTPGGPGQNLHPLQGGQVELGPAKRFPEPTESPGATMKTSIYIKLIRYFIGLILITCLTCAALFLVTMGRPLARQAHTLVKNHVRFMAGQVEILMAQNDPKALDRFLTDAGRAYGMDLALFNRDMEVLAKFSLNAAATLEIRPEMRTALKKNGRWVQSGHLSGATIYLLPIAGPGNSPCYLYISKASATLMPLILFLTGLFILCLLLILAIYPLAKSFTRPIRRLSEHLEEMAEGRFNTAGIQPERKDELGRLEETYTRMAASVKEMMASKKRLLADISHELRSPLGRMEVSAELLTDTCKKTENGQGVRQAEMMAAEIRSMTGLVRALSEYARINLPEFRLEFALEAPEELIRDLFSRNRHIMAKRGTDPGPGYSGGSAQNLHGPGPHPHCPPEFPGQCHAAVPGRRQNHYRCQNRPKPLPAICLKSRPRHPPGIRGQDI